MLKKIFVVLVMLSTTLLANTAWAVTLQPGSGLFQEQSSLQGGNVPPSNHDQQQPPSSRQAPTQVPEKLRFVFEGHNAMQSMGDHYISDVQTLLKDVDDVGRNAWGQLYSQYMNEFLNHSSGRTMAERASVPAGTMAVGALDNAGATSRQNLQFGIQFLFQGLGKQDGSDCQGTVRGMLEGKCRWGTPPVIENAVFANIIGGDVNLNQLNGHYEVWGVAPARATLISLIFNEGLFP